MVQDTAKPESVRSVSLSAKKEGNLVDKEEQEIVKGLPESARIYKGRRI